ncbi:MAG: zeta toxin family protein [Alphaproteobacteria bacterium]|nr:zeta toxin family protein [Alphaproteobacteria bacterium]
MLENTESEAPLFLLLAGPNGAGKSTFYRTQIKDNPFFAHIDFINWDEEIKKFLAEPETAKQLSLYAADSPQAEAIKRRCMLSSGKEILKQISSHIQNKQNFIYETVSASNTHLRIMNQAKQEGFRVASIFIGLSSKNLSFARVQQRVANGGHDVSKEDIMRRYPIIIDKFPQLLTQSDTCLVLDNSGTTPFKVMLLKTDDKTRVFGKFPQYMQSLTDFTQDELDNNKPVVITDAQFRNMTPEKQKLIIQNVLGAIRL